MNCKELKKQILDKTITISYLILTYKDSKFLADQYVNEISNVLNLNIKYVDSVGELPQVGPFGMIDNLLYVLHTDKFDTELSDEYKNVIVVCKSTSNTSNVISIPTPTEEQVLDYMKTKCSGLSADELKWLYDITKGDIYRIEQELNKISVFNTTHQEEMFNLLNIEDNYIDLSPFTIYNFVNAIINKDRDTMYRVITNLDNIDIEGTGLVTILRKNIKNIINIQFNPTATAEKLGMKQNQFNAIRHNVGKFSGNKLIDMFEFLTSIDYKLKSGNLQLSNERLIDYIICNIM